MHVPTNTYVHTQVIEYKELLSVALAMSVLFTFQVHGKPQFPIPFVLRCVTHCGQWVEIRIYGSHSQQAEHLIAGTKPSRALLSLSAVTVPIAFVPVTATSRASSLFLSDILPQNPSPVIYLQTLPDSTHTHKHKISFTFRRREDLTDQKGL